MKKIITSFGLFNLSPFSINKHLCLIEKIISGVFLKSKFSKINLKNHKFGVKMDRFDHFPILGVTLFRSKKGKETHKNVD